jgi:two-component system chemotaxis response regulator CheB
MTEKRSEAFMRKIRVVVGEDSKMMRQILVESLIKDPMIEVVGTGSDGNEVLEKIVELKPDCVTLDLEMPGMNGLETLQYVMSEWPTPVIIVSAHTAEGARLTLQCLEYGAVDFVPKTCGGTFFPEAELIAKVKLAAAADVTKIGFRPPDRTLTARRSPGLKSPVDTVVVIGSSTGGPHALMEIIPKLPGNLEAGVIVAQHMPPDFTRHLADRLNEISALAVREAVVGDQILPGRVLIAPGGKHLIFGERNQRICAMLLDRSEKQKSACPSVDFAMASLAPLFKHRMIGVVLTGMGRDGAMGCSAVREMGGGTICQDESSCVVFGMPDAVISEGNAVEVQPLDRIAESITAGVDRIQKKRKVYEHQ